MSNLPRSHKNFRGRHAVGPSSNNRQPTVNPWEGGVAPGCSNVVNMGNSFLANQNRGNMNNNNLGNPNNNNNFGTPNFGPSNMGYANQNMRNSVGGGLLPTPRLQPGPGLLPEPSVQAQLAAANNVLSLLLPHQQQQIAMNSVSANRSGGLLPLNPPCSQFQNTFGTAPNHGPQRSHGPHQGFVGPDQKQMSNWYQRPGSGQHLSDSKRSAPSPGEKVGARYNTEGKPESRNAKTGSKDDKTRDRNSFDALKEAYSNILSDLLHCHVCKKKMWDAISFVKHIKGKPHLTMIEKLEESYQRETETRRQEAKVEEQHGHEKLQQNKHMGPVSPVFCAMCNLNFVGNLTLHRKSSKHQKLKSFLHPKCIECRKEFSARIDWDHHLLSAGHLKEIQNRRSRRLGEGTSHKRGNRGVEENSNKRFKQSSQGHDNESKDKIKLSPQGSSSEFKDDMKQSSHSCDSASKDTIKQLSQGLNNEPKDNKVENGTSTILDAKNCDSKSDAAVVKEAEKVNESEFVISSPNVSKNYNSSPLSSSIASINVTLEEIPLNYDPHIEIGLEMLQEKTGYLCRCCNRFLSSHADSRTHCRSQFHYDKYRTYLKNKITQADKCSKRNEKAVAPAGAAESKDEMRVPRSDNDLQSTNIGGELKSLSKQSHLIPSSSHDEKEKEQSPQVKLEKEEEEDNEKEDNEKEDNEKEEEEDIEEDDESGNWKRKKNCQEDSETPTNEECPTPVN